MVPADIDETPKPNEAPAQYVRRLAENKARAVERRSNGSDSDIVLGADTVVTIDGQLLGKPADAERARAMLQLLSGRTHEVITGVTALTFNQTFTIDVGTAVTFRALTDTELAWYLSTGEWIGKAGAYGLQGAAAALIERVNGSGTGVIGLPLAATVELLRSVGLDPLQPAAQD